MTNVYARDHWLRAGNSLNSAQLLLATSPDDAAARAYYAVFHAVSALLACRGQTFTKHSALRAAVHRDLVRTGVWPTELGEAFETLWELRDVGDYGGPVHVQHEDAVRAVAAASSIVQTVRTALPELGE